MTPPRKAPGPSAAVASATQRQRARSAEIEAALERARSAEREARHIRQGDAPQARSSADVGVAPSATPSGLPATPEGPSRAPKPTPSAPQRAERNGQRGPARPPVAREPTELAPRPARTRNLQVRPDPLSDTGGIQLPASLAALPKSRPGDRQRPAGPAAPRRGTARRGSPEGLRVVDTTGQTARVVDATPPPAARPQRPGSTQLRRAPVRSHRPQVLLALCWAAVTLVVTLLGGLLLAAWMATAAAIAAAQAAGSRPKGQGAQPSLAALGAATIAVAGAFGFAAGGITALAMLVVIPAGFRVRGGTSNAGMVTTTLASVAFGVAGASVSLVRAQDSMLPLLLWLFLWMYDSTSFVLGAERPAWLGRILGMVALGPVAILGFVLAPFHGSGSWVLAGATAICIPLGVLLAQRWTLPTAEQRQTRLVPPAVGRLDSMMITAPVWALLIQFVL